MERLDGVTAAADYMLDHLENKIARKTGILQFMPAMLFLALVVGFLVGVALGLRI